MGCSSSQYVARVRPTRPVLQKPVVQLENAEWDSFCSRTVKEFGIYSDSARLKPLNYKTIIAAGALWEDETFPADESSLLDTSIRAESRHQAWKSFVWKRPSEVYGEDCYVVYEIPNPTSLAQGLCEDSYFLATLSAIAEVPIRIKRILLTKEANKAGCYAVQMFVNGEKKTVVVDDRFPFDEQKQQWAFALPQLRGRYTEIWGLILEKAWAKVFGSYQRIEHGVSGEAMYWLTGCPQSRYNFNQVGDMDGLWFRIEAAAQNSQPVCCCTFSNPVVMQQPTNDTPGQEDAAPVQVTLDLQKHGLDNNASYTVIGAQTLERDDLSEEDLVKVRNPFGMKEWTGDWSDNCPKWTVRARTQVNGENKADGKFFISLPDFTTFFSTATVCHYADDNHDNSIVDQHETGSWCMVKFALERDSAAPVSVTVDQVSERFMDKARDGSYKAATVRLIVTKLNTYVDAETYDVVFSQMFMGGEVRQESHLTAHFAEGLPKGVYVAFFQADWKSESTHPERKLVFSVYCSQPVQEMQRISLEDYDKSHIDTFNQALDGLVERNVVQQPADDKRF